MTLQEFLRKRDLSPGYITYTLLLTVLGRELFI